LNITYFGRQYGLCAEQSYGTHEVDLASSSIIHGAEERREPRIVENSKESSKSELAAPYIDCYELHFYY
jgi:hypothetical protein